jgi:hypothetical protein
LAQLNKLAAQNNALLIKAKKDRSHVLFLLLGLTILLCYNLFFK